MKVKSITLENVRAFEKATFEFGDGMNLIVGVNGVGKSTVLDALRFSFSRVLPMFSVPVAKQQFASSDIRDNSSRLKVKMEIEIEGIVFTYNLERPRLTFISANKPVGSVRGQTISTPVVEGIEPLAKAVEFQRTLNEDEVPPLLAIYFSPRRSLLARRLMLKLPSVKQILEPKASDRALIPRESNLTDFAEWWFQLAKLSSHRADAQIQALDKTLGVFLNGYHGIRPRRAGGGIRINKGNVDLDVRQLSDGEKSVLALVIELTRRLAQANPNLDDPTTQAGAIVLIDELDLHLHPGWQREIVEKLTLTFPKCQFICSTHSSQIIGEVEPENVSFIEDGEVFNQAQTLGLSSEWIIEHLMGTSARNKKAKQLIEKAERNLEAGDLDEARKYVKELRTFMHGPDGVVVRLNASINSLESVFDKKPITHKKRPSQKDK